MQTKNKTIRAFTLVEMLTTVAIIGILLAVLIPALSRVGQSARVVRQRAQFQTLEIALETFRNDTGDYPPSAWNTDRYGFYSASQRLAEAIVGRDGFGFHPRSEFHFIGEGYDDAGEQVPLYAPAVNLADNPDNVAARKGPYLELESARAVNLALYALDYSAFIGDLPSYVLADSFQSTRLTDGRRIGMPILYYRANRQRTDHSSVNLSGSTYDVRDAIGLSNDGLASVGNPPPPLSWNQDWFYDRTRNPNFTNRPYRAESFILHSAGPDGIFGTADDVFNFEEAN